METQKLKINENGSIEPKIFKRDNSGSGTTKELRKAVIDHIIELENNNTDNQLHTCCGKTSDKRLLVFVASISISLIVVIFSCVQLFLQQSCESQALYSGMISLVLGIWLKSPIS